MKLPQPLLDHAEAHELEAQEEIEKALESLQAIKQAHIALMQARRACREATTVHAQQAAMVEIHRRDIDYLNLRIAVLDPDAIPDMRALRDLQMERDRIQRCLENAEASLRELEALERLAAAQP